MERKEQVIGWMDIGRGVVDLIKDEALAALHGLFDNLHHEPRPAQSEHFNTDAVAPEYDHYADLRDDLGV